MYISSPAWSFKGKYSNNKIPITPNPSTYSPDQWKPMKSPSWTIGSQKRHKNNTLHKPGPGYYQKNDSTNNKLLGKFSIQKYHTFQGNSNPDPTKYSPNYFYNKISSPTHSFSNEYKQQGKENNPGVGLYILNKSTLSKGIKIFQQKRFRDDKKDSPGPGTYQSSQILFNSVSVNFPKQQKMKKIDSHQKQPGPGYYQFTDFIQENSKSKKGYTLASKHQNDFIQQSPGPSSYDPTTYLSKFSGITKVSMKGNRNSSFEIKSPGPADYSPKIVNKNFFGNTTIGKAQRNLQQQKYFNPGPGSYEESLSTHKKNPKYSIPSTGRKDKKINVPGPGAYEPSTKLTKRRPQSANIRRQKRYEEKNKDTPGPGQYNLNTKKILGKQTFIRQSKEYKYIQKTPGPGDYRLNSTFANLPSYAIK